MTVRIARPSDAAAIAEVLRAAFVSFEDWYTPAAFAATTPSAEQVTERLQEGPIWLAEQDGQVVGTVSVVPRSEELYLRSMAVHPAARGQGSARSFWQPSRPSQPQNIVAWSSPRLLSWTRRSDCISGPGSGARPSRTISSGRHSSGWSRNCSL